MHPDQFSDLELLDKTRMSGFWMNYVLAISLVQGQMIVF